MAKTSMLPEQTQSTAADPAKRRIQFSLRGLILIVFALSIALYFGVQVILQFEGRRRMALVHERDFRMQKVQQIAVNMGVIYDAGMPKLSSSNNQISITSDFTNSELKLSRIGRPVNSTSKEQTIFLDIHLSCKVENESISPIIFEPGKGIDDANFRSKLRIELAKAGLESCDR